MCRVVNAREMDAGTPTAVARQDTEQRVPMGATTSAKNTVCGRGGVVRASKTGERDSRKLGPEPGS